MYRLQAIFILLLLWSGLPIAVFASPAGSPRHIVKRGKPEYYTRNFNTISSIYKFTIFPNMQPIIAQAQNANIPEVAELFSPNVSGRIQDVGNFTNFRTSIEYFYGLAPQPRPGNPAAITAATIPQFVSGCPEVATSTVYFTISGADPHQSKFGEVITYLKQTGFWHFDSEGRVDYYDLYIPALGDFTTILNGADFNDPTVQTLARKQLCQGAQAFCTGANAQYKPNLGINLKKLLSQLGLNMLTDQKLISTLGLTSLNAGELTCMSRLLEKDFGIFDKLWSDTIVCRIVHLMLAQSDPEEHCPHVGFDGGMKCVEYPYEKRLFGDDDRLFGTTDQYPHIDRFICPDV
ncbi:hypothetical protein Dda_8866 [Drechslerella dactyloides]|uniref:Uncharacterized protein n=1 Tax=Drechslerella dactyloides TaxID=74499 RepID=A0AAD6ISX3_DREDA|nr:hypothetical protein Dda_8866 [Drechslerella dactyloides]